MTRHPLDFFGLACDMTADDLIKKNGGVMNNPNIKVTYECHTCGTKIDQVEDNHADVSQKKIPHIKPGGSGVVTTCFGDFFPVHLEVV